MVDKTPPQHWSQLSLQEQVDFWQGVDCGEVHSFLVEQGEKAKKTTRRRRGDHSTKPKCTDPSWFRPEGYKPLSGQLGRAYHRLVKKDPKTGAQTLRMRVSLHPLFVKYRQQAGRKYKFRPERQKLLDAIWPVLVSFCDAGKHTVGMCITRLATELSAKDGKGRVIPETEVTVCRLSRLLAEQVAFGTLGFSAEKEFDRVSKTWLPKHVYITATGWQMLGVDLNQLAREQDRKLRQSEERQRLIEEGILGEDEDISPAAARRRWAQQKRLEALKYRRQKGAERKLGNRLARLEADERVHEMAKHILKTLPPDEAYWCTSERLEQLSIQRLYQMDLALSPPS